MLASSAYMLGRDRDYLDAWELAYHSHLSAGEPARAAHCTWWIGDYRRFRGDSARATGWFARGHRLLDQVEEDCVARGYLLMPTLHTTSRQASTRRRPPSPWRPARSASGSTTGT